MNRRDFLLNTLKTAGAAAVLSQLDAAQLMAIPPEPTIPEGWTWDGSTADYLRRLNALTARELGRRGVNLVRLPQLAKIGSVQNDTLAGYQFNAAWQLPPDWRLGDAGRSPVDPRSPLNPVCQGASLWISKGDPINSIEVTAAGFAERIAEVNGVSFGELPLPLGVMNAARDGLFRVVTFYDIIYDEIVFRVDALIGTPL